MIDLHIVSFKGTSLKKALFSEFSSRSYIVYMPKIEVFGMNLNFLEASVISVGGSLQVGTYLPKWDN